MASGGIARAAHAMCRRAGISTTEILKKSGITRAQIVRPSSQIAVHRQIRFLQLAADVLGDEFLGLHLAQSIELREIGLLFYVMASSASLGDALKRVCHYSLIMNEGVRLIFLAGHETVVRVEYVGVPRSSDRHQIEFFIVTLVRLCRHLTRRNVQPLRLTLVHDRRNIPPEVVRFFGGRVEFGSPVDEVTFGHAVKDLPLSGTDPYLNRLLLKYCDEARSRRGGKQGSWRTRVENAIAPMLPHQKIRASDIARQLGVSTRTFGRRMAAEGLSFGDVLRELRQDLAARYLTEGDLPISKIAWLVGYSEVSSFSHAVKGWLGKSPRQVRASRMDRRLLVNPG
jgi:AraC-like DNA-binding protein